MLAFPATQFGLMHILSVKFGASWRGFMARKTAVVSARFLIGLMLGASGALIALAVWMIVKEKGSPAFVALAGSFLAAGAVIAASQTKKKL